MNTPTKTFRLEYDGRGGDLPMIMINYCGLKSTVYFYTDYEELANLDLTGDEIHYNYQRPGVQDCSIGVWEKEAWFTVSFQTDEGDGAGMDVRVQLTPESRKELCDVLEQLKRYPRHWDNENDTVSDKENDVEKTVDDKGNKM